MARAHVDSKEAQIVVRILARPDKTLVPVETLMCMSHRASISRLSGRTPQTPGEQLTSNKAFAKLINMVSLVSISSRDNCQRSDSPVPR